MQTQEKPAIAKQPSTEDFAKNSNGKWVLTEYDSEESVLTLESVEFPMPLIEIYERINFDVKDEEVNEPTSEIEE